MKVNKAEITDYVSLYLGSRFYPDYSTADAKRSNFLSRKITGDLGDKFTNEINRRLVELGNFIQNSAAANEQHYHEEFSARSIYNL